MKKTAIMIMVVMTLFILSATSASAYKMMLEYDGDTHEYNGEIYSLVVNNHLIDPPLSPIIFNDRALVPVREIFEEVGADVSYAGDTQTIEVVGENTYVTLRINDNIAFVNGRKVNIPDNVVPKLISKVGGETKTMVPVRFISDSIGLDVEFSPESGAILIESDGYTPAAEDTSSYSVEPYEEYSEPQPPQPQSVYDKLIVLDAGHGGSDSGAVGYLDGNMILEKNLTLEITNRVKNVLENAGYSVAMTRTDDTLPSLQERPEFANALNAAVFVSIHINSVDNAPNANGTEVFYATENNDDGYGTTSERLAANILERMLYYMGSTNRGVKTAEHAVTRRCNMPAALAEVGFITNPTEVYNMTTDEYQQKAAQGIAEGIMITLRDITVPR